MRLPIRAAIYDASGIPNPRQARAAALERVIEDLAVLGAHRLVIEQDDSLMHSDREVLFHAVRKHGVGNSLVYEHMTPRNEPLLWIPDAIAWCWAKNAHWRARVNAVVDQVHRL